MEWNPATLGISGDMLTMQSDNFENELVFLCGATHIGALGFIYSYGSYHRRTVWMNVRLVVLYLLLLGPLIVATALIRDTSLNCLLRINCSSEGSLKASGEFLGSISRTKSPCFLGPQTQRWADQLPSSMTLPDLVRSAMYNGECLPPEPERNYIDAKWVEISAINNILSEGFRYRMVLHFATHFVAMNAFYYFLVLHPYFDRQEEESGRRAANGKSEPFREQTSETELVFPSSSSVAAALA